jgi:mono/diheme cytochrome c family protein
MVLTKSTGTTLGLMLFAVISGIALVGQAGAPSQQEATKHLKKGPLVYSKPESGAQMWKDYCAACHGMSGRGDGPAAELLKSAPPDLSLLAKRNNGEFPADRFRSVLCFGGGGHAHGTSDMPIWGPLFRSQEEVTLFPQGAAELRIHNLSEFVKSLQQN